MIETNILDWLYERGQEIEADNDISAEEALEWAIDELQQARGIEFTEEEYSEIYNSLIS